MTTSKKPNFVATVASVLTVALVLTSCASKTRTTSTGRAEADIMSFFNDASKLVTAQSSSAETLTQVQNTEGAEIFFAESSPENRKMGPVSLVASLDFTQLGITQTMDDNSLFRAYFLAVPIDKGGSGALVIEYRGTSAQPVTEAKVFISTSAASIQNGEYQIDLANGDGQTLRVVSQDIVKGSNNLADVIQIQIYEVTSGSEIFAGKITTLQGYQLH